ncbi:MAG: energy transducer TonB [Betaproteobacteria bacterium]|nr:energy transducer TonB [Betaproteobacteria bacterium]
MMNSFFSDLSARYICVAVCLSLAFTVHAQPAATLSSGRPGAADPQVDALSAARERLQKLLREQERLLKGLLKGAPNDPKLRKQLEQVQQEIVHGEGRGYVTLTPSLREPELAAYYERFATRIECAAQKNYPTAAKGKNLTMIVTVSVFADGRLEKTAIEKTSGVPDVDAAVESLARAAAPYEKFTPAMQKRFHVIEFTAGWKFSQDNKPPPRNC